mmetsp:Transcript_8572/g.13214  ORF Transcript_8572/g.13214 Transcript_8572/m.13214 type:complete len:107 (+) Transcript_8572:158-478(+)
MVPMIYFSSTFTCMVVGRSTFRNEMKEVENNPFTQRRRNIYFVIICTIGVQWENKKTCLEQRKSIQSATIQLLQNRSINISISLKKLVHVPAAIRRRVHSCSLVVH